ncbi:hypothetical protein I7I53_12097 [Histoplasma capsulatum var. duboisii H88]|uniref:Uncharacterized protein n=1 Tax=Ajellomyces capsulatus (strain H88) TaxID=544711 RepID=A0A8A1LZH1_AJEC8|nr:hypothetical protein I7I53_12097 [Histoplasma capsulatum var. duboisii H88]
MWKFTNGINRSQAECRKHISSSGLEEIPWWQGWDCPSSLSYWSNQKGKFITLNEMSENGKIVSSSIRVRASWHLSGRMKWIWPGMADFCQQVTRIRELQIISKPLNANISLKFLIH